MTSQPLVPARHRFTVAEYHEMVRAGILAEDARVELIDGELLDMPPVGDRHISSVDRVADVLFGVFRDVAIVRVQSPVQVGLTNEPMPDVSLLRRRSDYYRTGSLAISDIYLVVEVGDTTSDADRRDKVPMYSRQGVKELWLVNLNRDTLTVYRDPTPDGYGLVMTLRRGDSVALLAFPDRLIAVTDLLGDSA